MKFQTLFSQKNWRNIVNLSSAEFARRVVKVIKYTLFVLWLKSLVMVFRLFIL